MTIGPDLVRITFSGCRGSVCSIVCDPAENGAHPFGGGNGVHFAVKFCPGALVLA